MNRVLLARSLVQRVSLCILLVHFSEAQANLETTSVSDINACHRALPGHQRIGNSTVMLSFSTAENPRSRHILTSRNIIQIPCEPPPTPSQTQAERQRIRNNPSYKGEETFNFSRPNFFRVPPELSGEQSPFDVFCLYRINLRDGSVNSTAVLRLSDMASTTTPVNLNFDNSERMKSETVSVLSASIARMGEDRLTQRWLRPDAYQACIKVPGLDRALQTYHPISYPAANPGDHSKTTRQ